MIAETLALLLSVPVPTPGLPQVAAVKQEEPLGTPLAGADHLLIATAARHPRMRGADLSCYDIYVHDREGARWVSFLEARERVVERQTGTGTEITSLPPDPRCRSVSFEMNAKGRVERVIPSRH